MDAKGPTDDQLASLALGELAEDDRRLVQNLLDASPAAQTRFQMIQTTLNELRSLRDQHAGFEVSRDRIVRLQAAAHAGLARPNSGMVDRARELVATLVFDSLRTATPGLRGSSGHAQLMHLACPGARITIRTERDEATGLLSVTGRVDPVGECREVHVSSSSTTADRVVPLAEDGYFEFETSPGSYALRFMAPGSNNIVIDRIEM